MVTINEAPQMIMIFVLIGFVGATGLLALSQFANSVQTTTSTAVLDDALTMANGTGVITTAGGVTYFGGGLAVTSIKNATATAETLATSNYTTNATTGYIHLKGGDFQTWRWNGASVVVNYTYNANTNPSSWTAIKNVSAAGNNVLSNMTTIGTLLGIALIVGVVLAAFGIYGRGRRGQ